MGIPGVRSMWGERGTKVGYSCKHMKQSLIYHYLLIIVPFICIMTVNQFLPSTVYSSDNLHLPLSEVPTSSELAKLCAGTCSNGRRERSSLFTWECLQRGNWSHCDAGLLPRSGGWESRSLCQSKCNKAGAGRCEQCVPG